jgi:tRNA threonylcarbamoyladenosine biosynthesis protein TsaB
MKLLAIETAASILSAAIETEQKIFFTQTEAGTRHSELVMELIDNLMKSACIKPKDLDGIICMGGPGSFTGLRIGYSIAKGLALSLSIPFAPVPTLECIAYGGQFLQGITLAVIEARKNAYFYAFFSDGQRLTEDKDSDLSQIADEINRYIENEQKKITLTGPGSKLLHESLPQKTKESVTLVFENKGYAKELIAIAKNKKLFNLDLTAFLYSGPEYIRKTDAEIALSR